jgi:serine O-acetyltransferase
MRIPCGAGAPPKRWVDGKSRIRIQKLRVREAFQQLQFLHADLSTIVHRRWWRWFTMWIPYGGAPGLLSYRLSRFLYLVVGERFKKIRFLLWPVLFLLRLLGPGVSIRYDAEIGPGIRILHPGFGVLVSRRTRCGKGLTLTGGNWIIMKEWPGGEGNIVIGDDVVIRANAILMGPVKVGDRCVIGAGAVVMSDCPAGSIMVGVPAKQIRFRPSKEIRSGVEDSIRLKERNT